MLLTTKQENFCNKYIECGNASEAYRTAYSCGKMKPESVNRLAVALINNVKIASRIEILQAELKAKSDISKERILEELAAILDSRITDYLDFDGVFISFKPSCDWTDKQVRAVESIKDGKNGIELKLHGKSWTVERICKMLGFDAPAKSEITGKEGIPLIPIEPMSRKAYGELLNRLKCEA